MRQPINIHIYLYRESDMSSYEYAIFQREDDPKCWQGISGGLEEGESVTEGALREAWEEAGVPAYTPLYPLDTVSTLPSDVFAEHQHRWGADVVVCPMYFFAMPYAGEIRLSNEHKEVRWLPYEEAERLVYWHDQKTALWEVHQRLLRGNLVRK